MSEDATKNISGEDYRRHFSPNSQTSQESAHPLANAAQGDGK